MSAQAGYVQQNLTDKWIRKYTGLERFLHWTHTVTFLTLAITGMVLFIPFLGPLAAGEAGTFLRLLHRIAAVGFGALPIIYAIFQPRRLWMNLKEMFTYGREDIGWVKALIPYYLLGRSETMPPQGRYNTGEKINGAVLIIGTAVFGITGLVMWFGKFVVPVWLFQVCVVLHDLAMIATFNMFVIHLFLAVAHPLMWGGLVSMRFGVASKEYVAHHHAAWLEELSGQGEEEKGATQAGQSAT